MRDITDRKEIEIELKEKIEAETEKNRQSEQLLIQQSRLAAMGEMMGAIAHQWRQPLAGLSAIMMNILDDFEYNELNEENLKKYIGNVDRLLLYMSHTIDDFRNFFKPSKEMEIFDFDAKICSALEIVKDQLTYHKISFTFQIEDKNLTEINCVELPPDDYLVKGYPNEMIQVILNIIVNAKDAISGRIEKGKLDKNEGFIRLKLYKQKAKGFSPVIRVSAEGIESQGPSFLTLEIQDNGGGIPKSIINNIYDPYFTTKPAGQGTGIGLYMAKMIIEKNMSGTIHAENRNNGVCVKINMPEFIGK
jgi:signal transduction histidine kinase